MLISKISSFVKFIAITTFTCIFIVIIYLSYDNLMNPSYKKQNELIIKPIDSHLDTTVLDQISHKQEYSDSDVQFTPLPTPTLSIVSTP